MKAECIRNTEYIKSEYWSIQNHHFGINQGLSNTTKHKNSNSYCCSARKVEHHDHGLIRLWCGSCPIRFCGLLDFEASFKRLLLFRKKSGTSPSWPHTVTVTVTVTVVMRVMPNPILWTLGFWSFSWLFWFSDEKELSRHQKNRQQKNN